LGAMMISFLKGNFHAQDPQLLARAGTLSFTLPTGTSLSCGKTRCNMSHLRRIGEEYLRPCRWEHGAEPGNRKGGAASARCSLMEAGSCYGLSRRPRRVVGEMAQSATRS